MPLSRNTREKTHGLLSAALAVFIASVLLATGCWNKVHYNQSDQGSKAKGSVADVGDWSPTESNKSKQTLHEDKEKEIVTANSKGVPVRASDTASSEANTISANDIFANVRSSLTSEPNESAPAPTNKVSAAAPEEPFPSTFSDYTPSLPTDQNSNRQHNKFVLPEFEEPETSSGPNGSEGSDTAGTPADPQNKNAEQNELVTDDDGLVSNDDGPKPAPATDLDPIDLPPNSLAINSNANTGETSVATGSPQNALAPMPPDGQPSTFAPTSTRRAAWMLGGKLVLATLAPEKPSHGANRQTLISDVQSLAELLDIPVPNLPKSIGSQDVAEVSNAALRPILSLGRQVGGEIARRYDDRQHVALFEVAFKSNLLLVLYEPDSPAVDSLADAIRAGAQRVSLPTDLWHPLTNQLAENASQKEVNAALQGFHQRVDAYLAED